MVFFKPIYLGQHYQPGSKLNFLMNISVLKILWQEILEQLNNQAWLHYTHYLLMNITELPKKFQIQRKALMMRKSTNRHRLLIKD